jgi:8-oxo-dGTP pyrophosphatase MutT (NUDIX family)
MPMSDYIRGLRDRIGTMVLEIPTASVIVLDDRSRVLLVRHVEGNEWTTPGGMIEPYETPSDAAVREAWEETGIFVTLTHVVGVFGGPLCAATYANGDQVAWISTVFGATPAQGVLTPDGEETLEACYFERADIGSLRCKPHARMFIDAGYAMSPVAQFQRPTWRPPSPGP